jgi:hypothetical protein
MRHLLTERREMHVDLSRPSPYDQSNGLLPIYSALHNSVDRDSLNSGRADQLARLCWPLRRRLAVRGPPDPARPMLHMAAACMQAAMHGQQHAGNPGSRPCSFAAGRCNYDKRLVRSHRYSLLPVLAITAVHTSTTYLVQPKTRADPGIEL